MSRTDTPGDPQFDARRLAARARLDALDDAGASDPYRRAWFAAVYDTAGDDAAQIPWADLAPHPLLAAWLEASAAPAPGARALDVGCGLGDNAAGDRGAGFSRHRVRSLAARDRAGRGRASRRWSSWRRICSRRRREWNGAFDLVHECYTLQALPDAPRADAMRRIAQFVRPGGRLLVIARARDDGTPSSGPPWPLSRAGS